MKVFLKKLLGIDHSLDDLLYRKLLLVNLMYIFAMSVFMIFAVINGILRDKFFIAFFDILFFVLSMGGYIYFKQIKDIEKSALFINIVIFLGIIVMLYAYEFKECIAAWGMLFPFVAMTLLGYKSGLRLTVLFDITVLTITFYFWSHGKVDTVSLFRLMNVLFFISVFVYFYEKSIELSYERQVDLQNSLEIALKETKRQAITDSLTGLYNKRYFDVIFCEEFNRAKREGKNLHLAVMDIDNFKRYNDTYGHERGDVVLEQVGHILYEQTKRSGDFAFRVGGEEFVLILQSCSSETFESYLDELRKKIEEQEIEHVNNLPYGILTISIGAVSVENYENVSMRDIYVIADKNLYSVKNRGRNAVKHTII